jgi:hypothetical protein
MVRQRGALAAVARSPGRAVTLSRARRHFLVRSLAQPPAPGSCPSDRPTSRGPHPGHRDHWPEPAGPVLRPLGCCQAGSLDGAGGPRGTVCDQVRRRPGGESGACGVPRAWRRPGAERGSRRPAAATAEGAPGGGVACQGRRISIPPPAACAWSCSWPLRRRATCPWWYATLQRSPRSRRSGLN